MIRFESKLPLKNDDNVESLSKLNSTLLSKYFFPKCRRIHVFPHCRTPFSNNGFRRGEFFHSNKFLIMFLSIFIFKRFPFSYTINITPHSKNANNFAKVNREMQYFYAKFEGDLFLYSHRSSCKELSLVAK